MASKIILKKSSVAAKAPVAADLEFGELALNYTDSKLYFKKADGTTIDSFSGSTGLGTVTSVGLTSGTGISVSGSPITTSGNITVTNTAPNVTTNISTTHNATTVVVNSSDGTDGTINAATTSLAGVMTGADKTKLDGIAAGATNVTNNNQLTNGAGYITSAASITGNAATATNISNTGTVTLATATESNSINITAPSYSTDTPVKLLNFDWYGNVFSMGNIRSGGTPTNGFGIYHTPSGGSRSEIARFNTAGNLRLASGLQQGADMARPLAQWSAAGAATGMVFFELPGTTSNYGMVHAVVDIYEYNSNSVCTVIVGGHNWNGAWYNVGANVIGQTNKQVRLGVRSGKYVICIGSAGSSWSYGTVVLRKIHNGSFYTGIMNMSGPFVANITTTESLTSDSGDLRALRTPSSFNAGGTITSTSDVRAPIFYDQNNTGYYVDPNSTSNLVGLTVANTITGSITGNAASITNQANSATITASSGVTGSHIVQRDGNGYIFANHINFNTSETENPTINSFITSNGDGWSRKSTLAHVKNSIRGVADGTWGINITGYAQQLNGYNNQTEYTILDGPSNGPIIKVRYDSATANRYIDIGYKDGYGIYYEGLKIYNGDTLTFKTSTVLTAGNYNSYALAITGGSLITGASNNLFIGRNSTATNYNAISLNGNPADSSNMGLTGGGVGDNTLYVNSPGNISVRTSSFSNSFSFSGGSFIAPGDVRAPIFYDSNDTGYYVDPAGASVSASLNGPIVMASTAWTGEVPGKIQYHSNNWYLQYSSYFHFRRADGGNTFYGDSSGNTWSIGSSRAPIFYDSDDTGYYVDPTSGSRLIHIFAGNVASSNDGGWNARMNLVGSSHARLDVVSNSDGIVTTMYSHTGQGVGKVGTYSNHPLVLMAQSGTEGGSVYAGSLRSPIFYDSNDTAYYANPNETSNLSRVTLTNGNLALTQGDGTGLRITTAYGYINFGAQNSSWTHVYSDKSFYTNQDWYVNGNLMHHDGNASRARNSNLMYYQGFTLDADTMDTNATGFTYAINAPAVGPIARFSTGGSYDLWLNAAYSGGGNTLYFRTRNGDANSLNSWRALVSYGVNYGDSIYASIYYDANDTGYYIDPNSTSDSALRMRGGALFGPNTSWGASLYVGGNGRVGTSATVAVTNGNLHLDSQNGYQTYINWYNNENIYTSGYLGLGSSSASHRLHVHGTGYATSDFRAPIFYDSNDTGYYTDPNGTSRLSYAVANRIKLVNYVDYEPRWDFTAYVVEAQHWYGNNSSMGMYMGEGNPIWTYNLRSNIYYDRDDTGYFGDYASTSVINNLNVAGTIQSTNGLGAIRLSGNLHIDSYSGNDIYLNYYGGNRTRAFIGTSEKFRVDTDGIVYAFDQFRSPIFYDSNNSAYYVDPASTSSLNAINVNGGNFTGATYFISNRNTTSDSPPLQVYSNNGSGAIMSFHRSGAYAVNFGLDSDNIMRIGGWSAPADRWVLDMAGNNWVASSSRAPIFYDSNDTAYYVDPNTTGTSVKVAGAITANGGITGNVDVRTPILYDSSNSYYFADLSSGGTSIRALGDIITSGSITAGGNITASSDRRIKKDIQTILDPIEKVKLLNGVTFSRTDLEDKDTRYAGLIAQDVEAVLPEAVFEDTLKRVDYNAVIGLLVESIKKQQEEIDQLKALMNI